MAQSVDLNSSETLGQLEAYYRQMLFIRHFEMKCNVAYREGKVGGYMHVYIGMEATAVGWIDAIRHGWDYVITAYRDHAHALLMGSDPVATFAEIMGRSGGLSKGKGGSMHLYDIDRGYFGGWGIVGAHTALGTGLGFAAKYRGEDRVALCFLGDGAANAGVFYESMNMASLWGLPVIYIIENNEYAMGTAIERHAADTELHKRGIPFDIKHERLDGMDVMQVRRDADRIIEYCRTNSRPYLVEIMNYRFAGHGAADNDQSLYRTSEEVDHAKERDPVKLLEEYFLKHNLMTREKMEAIEEEESDRAQAVYEEADKSPNPDPIEVYSDVYTDMDPEMGH